MITITEPNPFPYLGYKEPFICPYHNCVAEGGWCWECAEETFGYDKAKEVYEEGRRKE